MKRFERLSRLSGYRVDKHQLDPRGWDIVNADHRSIGEVKDVVVDTETMKGVYLDVELDRKRFDLHGDPHILVPVDQAVQHGTHKHLTVAGLDSARVQELCAERERHYYSFWEQFWRSRGSGLTADQLREALENVRPGEQIRIPVVEEQRVPAVAEEIVVERRPVAAE